MAVPAANTHEAGRAPLPTNSREDRWWVQPLLTFAVLGGFGFYATLRTFENNFYEVGPYISLTPGRYRVRIAGQARRLGVPVAYADIAVDGGSRVLVSFPLAMRHERGVVFEADIFLEAVVADFEVRVHVSADTDLVINKLEIFAEGEYRVDDRISLAQADSRYLQAQHGERRLVNAND